MDRADSYPRIGVVTPSYNQGSFIGETIDSVLSQNYPNLDYWIIDGGSTDDTTNILKSYGDRIKWISEQDRGQGHALNKGFRRIDGDVVAFLNSDDLYLPHTLSSVAHYFHDHPDAMWLTGDHAIIDGKGQAVQGYVVKYKRMLRKQPSFRSLAVANYVVQPSTFWRRGLLEEIGFFDESLHYCFDYDFWLRAIGRHPLHVINEPLSLFRVHGRSKGGTEFPRQFAEEHEVLRRHTSSKGLLALHRLHAALIVFTYNLIKR